MSMGPKKYVQRYGRSWDSRSTNFLYCDGHVETKNILDTLNPWQWGDQFYSLYPNNDVQNRNSYPY